MALGEEECLRLGSLGLGTEHLVLGILRQGTGVGARTLAAAGVELERARGAVTARESAVERPFVLVWTREARAALRSALSTPPVTTGRLLRSCLDGPPPGAAGLLAQLGVDVPRLSETLEGSRRDSGPGALAPG